MVWLTGIRTMENRKWKVDKGGKFNIIEKNKIHFSLLISTITCQQQGNYWINRK